MPKINTSLSPESLRMVNYYNKIMNQKSNPTRNLKFSHAEFHSPIPSLCETNKLNMTQIQKQSNQLRNDSLTRSDVNFE